MHRQPYLLGGSLATLLTLSSPARAQVYQVNSIGDESDANTSDGVCQTFVAGVCTLRAAVQQANVTGGLIQVPAVTITLTGSMTIQRNMSIVGAGMRTTHVSGNGLYQIFYVSGATADPISVSISDMTLRDGHAAQYGGAIYLERGDFLDVDRCFFNNNYSTGGGAIWADPYSDLEIRDSVLTDNHATGSGQGGAVFALGCSLTITNTAVHGNSAAYGGGLDLTAVSATVTNATISGNTAGQTGGGIRVGSTVDVPSFVTVLSSTVAHNRSYNGSGAGIWVYETSYVSIKNTVLANNTAGFIITNSNCTGPVTSLGNSVVPIVSAACTLSGSYLTGDPKLGPLQNNGGSGSTHALIAGSSALGTGSLGGCPLTDQRGVHRQAGVPCDIGAYEVSPCGDVDGDGVVGVADVLFLINYLFAGGPAPRGIANVSGDSSVSVPDVLTLINVLFAGGSLTCPTGT